MAKAKTQKKASAIDMTAMCDVAFLLLTFFILTATARQPEALEVDTPSSTVQTKLPDSDLATITIGGEDGKVFFGVSGPKVRVKTLELMGEEFKIKFTEEEKKRFSLMENFGVPITQLKGLIQLNSTERNQAGLQKGIPKDSTDNQLGRWIYHARVATRDIANKRLNVAIKGDAKLEYPDIKDLIDILQEQEVNSFNLVTGLRTDQF